MKNSPLFEVPLRSKDIWSPRDRIEAPGIAASLPLDLVEINKFGQAYLSLSLRYLAPILNTPFAIKLGSMSAVI